MLFFAAKVLIAERVFPGSLGSAVAGPTVQTVARLLYQIKFSLRVDRKQIATNSSPYRDQQFQHICSLRSLH
jgi:hypothetical protein